MPQEGLLVRDTIGCVTADGNFLANAYKLNDPLPGRQVPSRSAQCTDDLRVKLDTSSCAQICLWTLGADVHLVVFNSCIACMYIPEPVCQKNMPVCSWRSGCVVTPMVNFWIMNCSCSMLWTLITYTVCALAKLWWLMSVWVHQIIEHKWGKQSSQIQRHVQTCACTRSPWIFWCDDQNCAGLVL